MVIDSERWTRFRRCVDAVSRDAIRKDRQVRLVYTVSFNSHLKCAYSGQITMFL